MIWLTEFHLIHNFWRLCLVLKVTPTSPVFHLSESHFSLRVAKDTLWKLPRWEREPFEELSHQNEMEEGRHRPWGLMTEGKTTHLHISVCCLSPLKNPHRTGCTQIKEEVQRERILTYGVSRVSDTQHCAELDSSAWQPGEVASGNIAFF